MSRNLRSRQLSANVSENTFSGISGSTEPSTRLRRAFADSSNSNNTLTLSDYRNSSSVQVVSLHPSKLATTLDGKTKRGENETSVGKLRFRGRKKVKPGVEDKENIFGCKAIPEDSFYVSESISRKGIRNKDPKPTDLKSTVHCDLPLGLTIISPLSVLKERKTQDLPTAPILKKSQLSYDSVAAELPPVSTKTPDPENSSKSFRDKKLVKSEYLTRKENEVYICLAGTNLDPHSTESNSESKNKSVVGSGNCGFSVRSRRARVIKPKIPFDSNYECSFSLPKSQKKPSPLHESKSILNSRSAKKLNSVRFVPDATPINRIKGSSNKFNSVKNKLNDLKVGGKKPGIPVYKMIALSPKIDKNQLYNFEVDENDPIEKRKLKTQKVKKRARTYVRHQKVKTTGLPLKPYGSVLKEKNAHFPEITVSNNSFSKSDYQNDVQVDGNSCSSVKDLQGSSETIFPKDCAKSGHARYSAIDEDLLPVTSYSKTPERVPLSHHEVSYIELNDGDTSKVGCQTPNHSCNDDNLSAPSLEVSTKSRSIYTTQNKLESSFSSQCPENWESRVSYRFCSTPARDNTLNLSAMTIEESNAQNSTGVDDVSNCFGFDVPSEPEECLLSPIKLPGPARVVAPLPSVPSEPPLPSVDEVITILKNSVEDSTPVDIFSPSIDFSAEPLQDYSSLSNASVMATPGIPNVPQKQHNKNHRRSYERPLYARRRRDSDSSEGGEDVGKPVQSVVSPISFPVEAKKKKKRKPAGLSKKEEDELEKWAAAFNSQCKEISSFNLCIE